MYRGGEFYSEEILKRVDYVFQGLEDGGYEEFQERVQDSDKSTLQWIAAQLMNPTIDTLQGERMMQTMSKTNVFSGSQLVATVNGVLNGSNPNARILEIGCGSGQTFKQMARVCKARGRHWKLVGIDQSIDSIVFARNKLEEAGADTSVYQLQLADIDNGLWSFEDGTFDVAYHLNCWYFWKDIDRAVEEVARVVKPGGTLITGSKLSPLYDLSASGSPRSRTIFLSSGTSAARGRSNVISRHTREAWNAMASRTWSPWTSCRPAWIAHHWTLSP